MTSSGIKRGVAVAAVAALATVGLPLAASAQTIGGSGTALTLYSQYSGGASTDSDGTDTTVTLLAGMPTQISGQNVNSVRFSYDGGQIATVIPVDGVATTQWAAPAGTWTITVEALDNGGNTLDTDTRAAVVTNGSNPAVRVTGSHASPFSEAGEWDDEIVVRGQVTGGGDNALVSTLGPEGTTGPVGGTLSPAGTGISNFTAVLPLGANDTIDATDQVVVGARTTDLDAPGGTSDDVVVMNVYAQVVANVTKALSAGSSDLVLDGSGAETKWTLHAVDQKGNVIHGVNVFESTQAGAPNAGGPGTPDTGETDVDGNFEVTLDEDTIGGTDASQTTYYVVDVNEDGAYTNGTDYLFTFTQTEYTAQAATLEISNSLGDVMDDEENSSLTFLVKDQQGQPLANTTVLYKIDRVGHLPTADPAGTYVTGVTNAQGKLVVPFAAHLGQTETVTISAYVNKNGTPQPDAGDLIATPFVITTDETEANWDEGSLVQFLANTTQTVTGEVVQSHTGKAMPNRPLDIDYTDGTTPLANSILAPQAQQPAGTVRGSDYEAQVTTRADGTFGVTLLDPATPVGQELNANVRIADNETHPNGFDVENDPVDLEVDWLRSLTATRVEICSDISPTGGCAAAVDGLTPYLASADGNDPMPGALAAGVVRAFNADGVQLADADLTLNIDEGYFVDLADPFEGTPAPGQPVDFADGGKTAQVDTGDSAEGLFLVNIERNTGFDDDGFVDDKVTTSLGSGSVEKDFTWSTHGTPLNPRATDPLVVALSADQESSILPKARAGDPAGSGQVVDYDVSTWDQFGNPTMQDTTTTDNTPVADFFGGSESEYDLSQPALSAYADQAVNQTLEVELDFAVNTLYADNAEDSSFDPANPGASFNTVPVQIQESTDAINWYDLDFAASTFTLDNEGDETVPVGSTVTEVLTATDQEGQPIQGMFVDFIRGGPGNEDSDGNNGSRTNFDGEAFYDFAGGSKGVANVTAILFADDGTRLGTVGPDTVRFGPGKKVAISAKLQGSDNGAKDDVLKVNAPAKAGGATVILYKVKGDGSKVKLAKHTLNGDGDHKFTVNDKNGKNATKYVAKVKATAKTKADMTNKLKVK